MREVIIKVSDKEFETYFEQDPNTEELIRCKDCRYYFPDKYKGMECILTRMAQTDREYCSMGRKLVTPEEVKQLLSEKGTEKHDE